MNLRMDSFMHVPDRELVYTARKKSLQYPFAWNKFQVTNVRTAVK